MKTLRLILPLAAVFLAIVSTATAQETTGSSPVRHRTGKWIWCVGEAKPYHLYLFARRSFTLEARPRSARLHVTASDRYLLLVNGVYLGRGPARSDPRQKSYDTYDVASHLQPGKNTIAIRAYHYGTEHAPHEETPHPGNAYSPGERAGLWAELEMQAADGAAQVLGTDADWRVYQARGWDRKVKLINVLVGSTEVYNANLDPPNWADPAFNDAAWEKPLVIPQRALEWQLLVPRDIPPMREREIFPARIVRTGEVIDLGRSGQRDIPELLAEEIHLPLENATVENVGALLQKDDQSASLQGTFSEEKGIRAPFLILDFGRQVFGFPKVRLAAEPGAILDMTYSQQLIGGRIPNALRYGDRYQSRKGEQTWEVADYKQFRYLHLTLRSHHHPVRIESISLNEYGYPAEQKGNFTASDEVLTKLWQACADTTLLHLEDSVVCDAYRERAVWSTGDGAHGLHGIYAAFGDLPLTDHFFRSFPITDRGDGMLRMAYPPEQADHYNIPQFLLQWSERVRTQYLFTGRKALAEELYQSVQRQLDWFEPHRDRRGLLRDLPMWNFWDWTPTDMRGANFTTNALYLKSLEDAAWLAEHLEVKKDAARWRKIAGEVRAVLRSDFWNDLRGRFEDSHFEGQLTGIASEVSNAYALLYGIADADQIPRIGQAFLDRAQELVQASPLYVGYVLDGLFEAGFDETAIQIARTRFAPMLKATDHPTIWEGWGPFTSTSPVDSAATYHARHQVRTAGVRSLVHSGGVLAGFVLSTRVLGVHPKTPGFAECIIQPHPGDLRSARGVLSTPRGDLGVEWKKESGRFTLTAQIPDGVRAEMVLERDARKPQTLLHNGQPIAPELVRVEPRHCRILVGSGHQTVEVRD